MDIDSSITVRGSQLPLQSTEIPAASGSRDDDGTATLDSFEAIASSLASAQPPHVIIGLALATIRRLFAPAEATVLIVSDDRTEVYRLPTSDPAQEDKIVDWDVASIARSAVATRQPIQRPRLARPDMPAQTCFATPITWGHGARVLVVVRNSERGFGSAAIRWFVALARLIRVGLEYDRLLMDERRQARHTDLLLQLTSVPVSSMEEYLQQLASIINKELVVNKTDIMLFDEAHDQLVSVGLAGETMASAERRVGLDRLPIEPAGAIADVFKRGEPVLIDKAHEREDVEEGFKKMGVNSILGVPIVVDGERRGVIHIASQVSHYFTADDMAMLTLVAARVGLLIKNAELAEQESRVRTIEAQQEARQEFLGIASHELKTPVAVLTAYTEVLMQRAEKSRDDQVLSILDRMNYQAERMVKLIDGLLDLRRIEDGRLSLEFNRFDVAKLVKGTIDEWRMRTSDREFTVDGPNSLVIFADRQRIEDVLSNLLDNAVKFSPAVSGIHTKVRSLMESDEPMVEVSVIDRGTGLDPEESEHIFERFYQGRKVLHKGHSGLGLGLYFSKQIVERHGGTLTVDETSGGGCTFRFTLATDRAED